MRRSLLLSLSVLAGLLGQEAWAERTIRGTVVDSSNKEPVPLAQIKVQGTDVTVEADAEGRFELPGMADGPVVVRIYEQDHMAREVTFAPGKTDVRVELAPAFVQEVEVVGRGTDIARRHQANASSRVEGGEVNRTPTAGVDQALQGKVAGANIQSNSGAPGGGLQIKMRGVSTIVGQSQPLYVVDGVIMSDVAIPPGLNAITASAAGSNPSSNQDNQVNRIADLNPNDIENIEILKGAAAAALYGSKASNGVVLITTKKGRAGSAARVELAQRVGFYALSKKLGLRRFTSAEEAESVFAGGGAAWTPNFYDHEQELAGRVAPSFETVASVSGGGDRTTYFLSGLVKGDQGIIQNTGYDKQSLRINLGQRFGDRLDVNVGANLLHTKSDRGLTNNDNAGVSYYMVMPQAPSFYDLSQRADGTYPSNPFINSLANPLQTAALLTNAEDVWRLVGSGTATLRLIDGSSQNLKLLGNFGFDSFRQKNNVIAPPELNFEPVDDGLAGTSILANSDNLNLNGGLNLVHFFKPVDGVALTTSVGAIYETRDLDTTYVVARNLNGGISNVNAGTNLNVAQNRARQIDRGVYVQEEALLLDEKLTLSGALLAEASTVNAQHNKLFYYPKLAAAYRLTDVLPDAGELKFRAAYGETGNLPQYGQRFTPLLVNNNVGGAPGLVIGGVTGAPDLHPERQREFEVGVDASLFEGRGALELTVYQKDISDLLLQRTLAPSTGFRTQIFNGAGLRNRGVELMAQAIPVQGTVDWTTRAIFSLNRSVITHLPVPAFNTGGFGVSLGAFRIEEGKSATQIVGNVGKDANGKPIVGVVGDAEPDFRLSFFNEVGWNGFRLGALLDWQQGSEVINLTRFLFDGVGNSPDVEAAAERLKRWSARETGVYVEDASFLKVREVNLSYTLPESVVSGWGPVRSARVVLSGRNLLTFTNYSGLDPEVSNFGNQPIARNIDVAPFPPSRSFWTSIELGF